jgi:hypothetical protein
MCSSAGDRDLGSVSGWPTNSPRLSGAFWALAGTAILLWEWLRDRGPGPWLPGHGQVLAILCAPVLILLGLRPLLYGPRSTVSGDVDNRPLFLIGVALGFVNAHLLGVWRSVGAEGFRQLVESWFWMFVVAAAVAALVMLRGRSGSDPRGRRG